MSSEPDELTSALEEERKRAQRAERALARLQTSLPMTVGQLVIDAGADPRRLLRLPFDLLRIRAERRRARAEHPVSRLPVPLPGRDGRALLDGADRLLLPRRAVVADTRPSVLAVAPENSLFQLRERAHVSIGLPHDAAALMAVIDADVVLVDARVGESGSPWYPLGQPGEARREASLIALQQACADLGRPLVLVHDPVATPGLIDFASRCDLVLSPVAWGEPGAVDALLNCQCRATTHVAEADGRG